MAIIYSYPTVTPTANDLVLGTDVDNTGKATRNFTVQSIIDLVTVTGNNLQDVLNNGNIAVGRDIILGTVQDPTQTIYANTFSTGVASIVGGVGQNFTDFTSTRITGTLQTAAQPNITSVGTLVSLKVGTATPAITSIVTTLSNPGDNIKLATTKAIVDYIATTPNPETLAQTLQAGNITNGTDIAVSAGDDVIFTDTSKIILGTGSDATIEHDGTDLKIVNTEGKTTISNTSGDIDISATAVARKLNLNGKAGVELQFDTGKRLETLNGGAKVSGTFEATGVGTLNGIVNTNSYTANNGVGTAGQILSSTVTGTSWIADPNPTPYSWLVEADSGTGSPYTVANGNQIHFKGDTNISTSWDNANKEVLISLSGTSVTGSGAANQVTYWDGAQTITGAAGLTFAGGANGKVAIAGELEVSGVLTDGTFTGQVGAYTGFASIASTVFVGPLQGNADTATALAAAGAVSMSGDAVASGVTYTSGGNVPLVSTISDSVVYNKELAGFNETNGSVADGDSILEALEKLQGQITNLPQGIVYQGVWNPGTSATSGGTPDLRLAANKINGHYYIVSTIGIGTPNGDGTTPNDWDVRDWCVFADDGAGGGADEWQKIDNSSLAGGTGTPNTMTKWLTNQTIGNSKITDDGSIVTIADTIDFTTQGNNTFGNTSADTTLMKGNTTLEENLILAKGLSLGADYGSAGQALISGGGINVANSWANLTVGEVTSVTGLYGITVAGTTAVPTIAVTSDADNLIKLATAKATPVGADTILINDSENSDVLKQATLTSIKTFTAESWILSDGTNNTTIANGDTAKFQAAGTGIAVGESGGTVTITGSENPGTGTALTLPVWEAGGATLGDSMVSQDAAVGTKLTISSVTPALIINDTTANKGDLKISRSLDATTYMSSGKISPGSYGKHVFSQTDGSTPREILTLDEDRKGHFAGAVGINTVNNTSDTSLKIDAIIGQDNIIQGSSTNSTNANEDCTISLFSKGTGSAVINVVGPSIDLRKQGTSMALVSPTGVSVTGALSTTTSAAIGTTLTTGGSITVATHGLLSIIGGNNLTISGTAALHAGLSFATQAILPATVSATNNALVDLGANGNQFKDLYLSGNVIHGGSGTGTKGGTFTKLYTTGTVAAGAATAFSISRATTGSMVFDVMFTGGTRASSSVTKKFTVVKQYGNADSFISTFKILDTGPGTGNTGTDDFTVAFEKKDTDGLGLNCTIAAVAKDTQKIGITIILGFGENDATVVMNA